MDNRSENVYNITYTKEDVWKFSVKITPAGTRRRVQKIGKV